MEAAVACLDDPDKLKEALEEYEAAVDAFLQSIDDEVGKETKKGKTLYRKKAQMWIRCLEKQIKVVSGHGFSHWGKQIARMIH